jgi:hypothetical protein
MLGIESGEDFAGFTFANGLSLRVRGLDRCPNPYCTLCVIYECLS